MSSKSFGKGGTGGTNAFSRWPFNEPPLPLLIEARPTMRSLPLWDEVRLKPPELSFLTKLRNFPVAGEEEGDSSEESRTDRVDLLAGVILILIIV